MIALKKWTGLGFLSCFGAVAFVACGEADCEKALCIERPGPVIDVPDANDLVDAGEADGSSGAAGNNDGNQNGMGGEGGTGGNMPMAGTGGDSGIDSGAGGGPDAGEVGPPVCGANPVAGCIASTEDAVFVDVGMAVSGDGSQTSPVKSIAEGIELARTQDATRIVVCNGVYEEAVALTADDSGRSLSGGFNCDDWLFNPDGETLVRPTEQGFALEVRDTTQRVILSNFTLEAQPAVDPGESSVTAFVAGASDVRLKQVRLIAHDGQSADDGLTHAFVAGVANEWPSGNDLIGNDGLVQSLASNPHFVGGARTEVSCPGGEISRSGRGGSEPGVEEGEPGQLPVGKGGGAGTNGSSNCATCVASVCGCQESVLQVGGLGDPGDNGVGAAEYGVLDADGWQSAPGMQGEIGYPGGGGGGGDGAWQACAAGGDLSWFGGGGGGAGGCGGNGGAEGVGGGSSIALAILDSKVVLTDCDLLAGNAAAGSTGGAGQSGQAGGTAGAGIGGNNGYSDPCGGGAGGPGGQGGAGGGGAGGVSVGVVWAGDFEPTLDADTLTSLGDPGAGGIGGDAGENDGIDGVAEATLEVSAG